MSSKILINAVDPAECRIAKVKNNKLEDFHIETAAREITQGNIYKAVITRIEPSLQAVFVDYGAERNGFLQKHEIHQDYYQDLTSGDTSITNIVKKGQELLVQVSKDPIMKKGAMMTTYISLAGRYVVLMPGHETKGVSRKIEDDTERVRLKGILKDAKLPEGFGAIVRTAGAGCTKTQITRDLRYLMRLWKTIKESVMKVESPHLMHKEQNLVLRVIRDYFTSDVTEILVDDASVHQEAKKFMNIISPKHTKIVKHYRGEKPIFTKHQLEEQIATIYESRVGLKSGGSIVIQPTEALVAIDVNSGKATQKKSVEQTALQTNLEAVEEIARQLRLRDLGGIIILDLIDMRESKHKTEVERTLKTFLKEDKAKTKVSRISKLGLIEMSRQRLSPSIDFGSFEPCKFCGGKGQTPSVEKLGLGFLRQLNLETIKQEVTQVKAVVPHGVAEFLLNRKRKEINELEVRRDLTITIIGDRNMVPGENRITVDKSKK